MSTDRPLLIGISARIYYPTRPVLDMGGIWTRTLHYLEQSVAHWLMSLPPCSTRPSSASA